VPDATSPYEIRHLQERRSPVISPRSARAVSLRPHLSLVYNVCGSVVIPSSKVPMHLSSETSLALPCLLCSARAYDSPIPTGPNPNFFQGICLQ
jgi:hypothetical protein